jgi:hypothetical protein
MMNRYSYLVFFGVVGFVFTGVTVGCASSRIADHKGSDASLITSADSTIEPIKEDAEDFIDVGKPTDGSVSERGDVTVEPGDPRDGSVSERADGNVEPSDKDAGELPKTQIDLCNGSTEIQLYVNLVGSGNKIPGVETSYSIFILDEKCQIYLKRSWWDPIRVRTLTSAEIEELKTALRVEEWPAITGTHYRDDCVSYYTAWVAGYEIVVGHAACPMQTDSSAITVPPYKGEGPVPISNPPIDIYQLAYDYLNAHYDEGTPISGPVRYALCERQNQPTDDIFRGAEPWPFGDPAEIAITVEEQYSYPPSEKNFIADGEQADILRELRRRFNAWEISYSFTGTYLLKNPLEGIPILQPNGEGYELFVCDISPFEDDTGRLILPGNFL